MNGLRIGIIRDEYLDGEEFKLGFYIRIWKLKLKVVL